ESRYYGLEDRTETFCSARRRSRVTMSEQEKEKTTAAVTTTEAPAPATAAAPKAAPAPEETGSQYFFGEPLVGFDPSEITGRLIVVEGMDGSGRSTRIALLQERLESAR